MILHARGQVIGLHFKTSQGHWFKDYLIVLAWNQSPAAFHKQYKTITKTTIESVATLACNFILPKRLAIISTAPEGLLPVQILGSGSGYSLKRKCRHFDEILITGCTGSCQNDNFQCSQWLKFRQNDDIFVSVLDSE